MSYPHQPVALATTTLVPSPTTPGKAPGCFGKILKRRNHVSPLTQDEYSQLKGVQTTSGEMPEMPEITIPDIEEILGHPENYQRTEKEKASVNHYIERLEKGMTEHENRQATRALTRLIEITSRREIRRSKYIADEAKRVESIERKIDVVLKQMRRLESKLRHKTTKRKPRARRCDKCKNKFHKQPSKETYVFESEVSQVPDFMRGMTLLEASDYIQKTESILKKDGEETTQEDLGSMSFDQYIATARYVSLTRPEITGKRHQKINSQVNRAPKSRYGTPNLSESSWSDSSSSEDESPEPSPYAMEYE